MTPRTLIFERRYPSIGRIRIASGTTSARRRDKYHEMADDLYYGASPRHDVIRDIKAHRRTLADVYPYWSTNRMHLLPAGGASDRLAAAWAAWAAGRDVGPDWSKAIGDAWTRIVGHAGEDAAVSALPDALLALRRAMGERHPRAWNVTRGIAVHFLSDHLGERDPVTDRARGVKRVKDTPTRKRAREARKHPLPVAAFAAMLSAFPHERHRAALWALASTGMRPEEYWEEKGIRWTPEAAGGARVIHVHGIKTDAAERYLPDLGRCARPQVTREAMKQQLRLRLRLGQIPPFTLYDCRRSFEHWCEEARLRDAHIKRYFGHGPKSLTQSYGFADVEPYIAEDRATLLAYVEGELSALARGPKTLESHEMRHDAPRGANGHGEVSA